MVPMDKKPSELVTYAKVTLTQFVALGTSTTRTNSHTIVEHNLFEDQNGEIELISSKSHRNIFR